MPTDSTISDAAPSLNHATASLESYTGVLIGAAEAGDAFARAQDRQIAAVGRTAQAMERNAMALRDADQVLQGLLRRLDPLAAGQARVTQETERYAQAMRAVADPVREQSRLITTLASTSGRFGDVTRQLAGNLGEVAVRAAAGDHSFASLGAQAGRFLQTFGPIGGVLGAAAEAGGLLADRFLTTKGAMAATAGAVADAAKAMDGYHDAVAAANGAMGSNVGLSERMMTVRQEETIIAQQLAAQTAKAAKDTALAGFNREVRFGATAYLTTRGDLTSDQYRDLSGSEPSIESMLAVIKAARKAIDQGLEKASFDFQLLRDYALAYVNAAEVLEQANKKQGELSSATKPSGTAFVDQPPEPKPLQVNAPGDRFTAAGESETTLRQAVSQALEDQIEGLRQEADALEMSQRARFVSNELLKAEETARHADMSLTAAQIAELEREAGALWDKRAARNANLEAEQEAQSQARRAADEMQRAAEHAGDRISDSFADMLVSGEDAFASLGEVAERTFAEIAANSIIRPVVQPVVSGVMGGSSTMPSVLSPNFDWQGLGNNLALAGPVAGAAGMGDIGTMMSLGSLAASGFSLYPTNVGGYVVGSEIGQTIGLGVGTMDAINASPWGVFGSLGADMMGLGWSDPMLGTVASTAGSVGGAYLGASLGSVGGPIGAIVGSFLATAMGSLFEADADYPWARTVIGAEGGQAVVLETTALDGGDAAATAEAGQQMVDTINAIVSGLGGTVVALDTTFGYNVQRPGSVLTTGYFAGDEGTFAAGATYMGETDSQQAAEQAVLYALDSGTFEGLTEEVQRVFDQAMEIGSLDEIDRLLGVSMAFDETIQSLLGGTEQFQEALDQSAVAGIQGLIADIDQFRADATTLYGAGSEQEAAAIEATKALAEMVAGIREMPEPMSEVEVALATLDAKFRAVPELLEKVGYSAEDAAALAAQGRENALADLAEGFDEPIAEALSALQDPMGHALAQLDESFDQMRADAILVGGDLAAIEALYGAERTAAVREALDDQLAATREAAGLMTEALETAGRDYRAGLLEFDLEAMANLADVAMSGGDVALAGVTYDAERAALEADILQQRLLDAIDLQIGAIETNTAASQDVVAVFGDLGERLVATADAFAVDPSLSPLSPLAQLEEVRRQWEVQADAADAAQARRDAAVLAGDDAGARAASEDLVEALVLMSGLGQSRIEAARGYYATSNFDDYWAVDQALRGWGAEIGELVDPAQASLDVARLQLDALEDIREEAARSISQQVAALTGVSGDIEALQAMLSGALTAMVASQDALADQLGITGATTATSFDALAQAVYRASPVTTQFGADVYSKPGVEANRWVDFARALGYTGQVGNGQINALYASDPAFKARMDQAEQMYLAGKSAGIIGTFGFASGGVMTSRGPLPLTAYASGGVANSPQLALFGEGRMPEAYVPLPDGRSIPVSLDWAAPANDDGGALIAVLREEVSGLRDEIRALRGVTAQGALAVGEAVRQGNRDLADLRGAAQRAAA